VTEDIPRPKVGIWRAVAGLLNHKAKHLLWPEGVPSIAIGAGGAVAILHATSVHDRVASMSDLVQLSVALLAIVFTALAIVVALPSGRYLRALEGDRQHGTGMKAFLDPFLVAVGTQIVVLLFVIGFKLVGTSLDRTVEHVAFYILGFLVVYGLLDVAALARSLVRHGIYRAIDSVREHDEGEQDKVATLADRRQV
jgi:hypothetical protein